jgi:3D (Asp-Asp-Asp) domain-containing protein
MTHQSPLLLSLFCPHKKAESINPLIKIKKRQVEIKMSLKGKIGVFLVCRLLFTWILFFTFRDGIVASANGNDVIDPVTPKTGIFTEYTATVSQTDDTPTITASNQKIREGIVANNCLPFGTRIKVNNNIYVIQDRMNERYGCEDFDIYVKKYSQARHFGRQTLKYEII